MHFQFQKDLAEFLSAQFAVAIAEPEAELCPPDFAGDVTVSCFPLAKTLKRNPMQLAEIVRDYLANNHFTTVLGDTWFENNMIAPECFMGNVGQWQNGIFEVIDRSSKATSDPIVPKPEWPAA